MMIKHRTEKAAIAKMKAMYGRNQTSISDEEELS